MSFSANERTWSEENFSGAILGDERRVQRVVTYAQAMAAHPGKSIPQLFDRPYDVKAVYNLLSNPDVTPDGLQSGHRDLVFEALYQPGTYLLIEDGSDLSWAGNQPIEGLGPIGTGAKGLQGFSLHTVIAVRWPNGTIGADSSRRPPLKHIGLADQQFYIRPPKGAEDKASRKRRFSDQPLETYLWEQASSRIGRAPSNPDIRWVRVCDAGADIYEFLMSCQQLSHDFVVRACKDRILLNSSGKPDGNLFDRVRQVPAIGGFSLKLRSRPGQAARTAHLSIGILPVCLRSPQRPGHVPGSLPPIECTAIRVWEANPDPGVEPLEWILLARAEVTTFEQALECALQYASRWLVEEFHKALKTGLGAERLQLETAHGLFAAIAIMSVVALRLINLREWVRWCPDAPAERAGLDPLELTILSRRLDRKLATVKDVALAIGRLGGHMNRKGDGMPGWQTFWRGMTELQTLVAGARLARQMENFG